MASIFRKPRIQPVRMFNRDCPVFSLRLAGRSISRYTGYEIRRSVTSPVGWEGEEWELLRLPERRAQYDRYKDQTREQVKSQLIEESVGVWPPLLFRMLRRRRDDLQDTFGQIEIPHPLCDDCGAGCFSGRIEGENYSADYRFDERPSGRGYLITLELQDCRDPERPDLGPWDFAGKGVFLPSSVIVGDYKPSGLPHPHIDTGGACLDRFAKRTIWQLVRAGDAGGALHTLLMTLRQINIANGFGGFYSAAGLYQCPGCGRYRVKDSFAPGSLGEPVCASCRANPERVERQCNCYECRERRRVARERRERQRRTAEETRVQFTTSDSTFSWGSGNV